MIRADAPATPAPIDPERIAPALRPRASARALPPEASTDPEVLAWELEHLFARAWVCAGREEDVPASGDLMARTFGSDSVLIVRGEDGEVRGFHNVCQHRGSRLVMESDLTAPGSDAADGSGRGSTGGGPIVCPYHSWTYGLDGRLRAAEHMQGVEDFRLEDVTLSPVPVEALDGFLFANASGTAGPLAEQVGDLPQRIARFACGDLRRAERRIYDVAANWKVLSQNYQECYHCPSIHPELVGVTAYRSGRDDAGHGAWLGGPMDLAPGCSTMSVTGSTDRAPLPGLSEDDRRHVIYYSVLPNLWLSLHPDYVMTHTIWPLAPDRTRVECEWLFHPEAMAEAGFDAEDAVGFWDIVNRQDWAACERVQLGITSRGFAGGRFSDMEGTIHALDALIARSYLAGRLVGRDDGPE